MKIIYNKNINIDKNINNYKNETDQNNNNSDVVSSNNKDKNINSINISFWKSRSFTYEKISFINSRNNDIIILNETWNSKLNVSGYNATKVLLDRSKFLLIISSYFLCSNKTTKWNKKWAQLLELIEKYSLSQNNMNIVIGCDFNKDISNDDNMKNQLQTLKMKIVQNLNDSTFEIGNKKSKIDHYIVAENIKCGKIQFHRSISDHKLISLEILDVGEVPRSSIKIINRKLAKEIMIDSLMNCKNLEEFISNHHKKCRTHKNLNSNQKHYYLLILNSILVQ